METVTSEALRESSLKAGWTEDEIRRAAAIAATGDVTSLPLRRARAIAIVIVLVAYGIVYGLLMAGMAARSSYGTAAGMLILSPVTILALVISGLLLVLRVPGGSSLGSQIASLVAVPIVLLLLIGGACVATGLPIPNGGA